jgi:hypothetical protein
VAALVLAVLVPMSAAYGAAAASPAQARFRIVDPRLDEASGIGVGIASPGVVYVQNDSGDAARFFALDATTGDTLAVYTVPAASNVDWEDLAVARDARGVPSVWLADIGDNQAARGEVRIYRVDEPIVDRSRRDAQLATADPSVWRLTYPDGPVDAEGLAVGPGGAAYVVTKSFLGDSSVFAVPPDPDPARSQLLRRVGGIRFSLTGTPGGPSLVGQLTATGAALSADGRAFAVRTYTDACFWPVSDGDVAGALRRPPVRVPLPAQAQGEGITFDGTHVLLDSEGVGSTVYAVPTPPLPTPSPSPARRSGPSGAAASPSSAPADDAAGPGGINWVWPAVVGAALVVGIVVLAAVRRR